MPLSVATAPYAKANGFVRELSTLPSKLLPLLFMHNGAFLNVQVEFQLVNQLMKGIVTM